MPYQGISMPSAASTSFQNEESSKTAQKDAENDESELRLAQLQHQLPYNEPGALMHLMKDDVDEDEDDEETKECKSLFKDLKFYLSREVVDRPSQGHMFLFREYVQPQWVFDCVVLIQELYSQQSYTVGRVPPPHLSPFVDDEAQGYVPEYAETIKRLQAAASKEVLPLPGVSKDDIANPQNLLVEGVIN